MQPTEWKKREQLKFLVTESMNGSANSNHLEKQTNSGQGEALTFLTLHVALEGGEEGSSHHGVHFTQISVSIFSAVAKVSPPAAEFSDPAVRVNGRLIIFLKDFYFVCMSVLPAWVSVNYMHAVTHGGLEKGLQIP